MVQETPNELYISEIMTYPASGHEWVELYNNSSTEAQLIKWYFDDIDGQGASPQTFTVTVPPFDFTSVELSTSILNNTGDDIRLLDNNLNLIDRLSYNDSKKGYTWGRNNIYSTNVCLENPSPDEKNNDCLPADTNELTSNPSQKPTPTLKTSQKATNSDNVLGEKLETKATLKHYVIQPAIKQKPTNTPMSNDSENIIPIQEKSSTNSPLSFLSAGYCLLALGSVIMKIYRASVTL
jgi:hypothetical protein